jgi:hypothetical protein
MIDSVIKEGFPESLGRPNLIITDGFNVSGICSSSIRYIIIADIIRYSARRHNNIIHARYVHVCLTHCNHINEVFMIPDRIITDNGYITGTCMV